MNHYLPEAMLPALSDATPESLLRQTGGIVAATALWCDERHNLHVSLGGVPGVIRREDAAMGVADGSVRDIAILSRVGRQICCKVLGAGEDGAPRLSRAAAQREAQAHLMTCRPGDILPAVVESLAPFGAFCDVGCGFPALLGIENISVSRLSHSADRFSRGQRIYVVLRDIDRAAGRVSLSHKELLGDWAENAAAFSAGQTVVGVVRSVQPYGVFVELAPNLSGLAEPDPTLRPGDAVTAFIKVILPEKMKIKLSILGRADIAPPRPAPRYTKTAGRLESWRYGPLPGKPCSVFSGDALPRTSSQ